MRERRDSRIPRIALCIFLVLGSSSPPASGVREQAVSLSSTTGDVELAGTLALPDTETAESAVVLLSVAGPDDRDMSLGERGVFRELAEFLSERGIASLRLDDRGVDDSGGDWRETTLEDRTGDAIAALRFLSSHEATKNADLGLVGVSEGGAIAIAAASRSDLPDFVVALSTPMHEGRTVLRNQRERMLTAAALPDETKVNLRDASERLLEAIEGADRETVRAILVSPVGPLLVPRYRMVPEDLEERVEFLLSPWYLSQVTFDIAEDVQALDIPVYAAYGELDQVLEANEAAELLRSRLPPGIEGKVEVRPGLNHLLMPAVTGSPAEYPTLPELLDRSLWEDVVDWIESLDKAP